MTECTNAPGGCRRRKASAPWMWPLGLLLGLGAWACEDDSGGLLTRRGRETLSQDATPKVDILWVIDNSASMGAEQRKIADEATAFLARLIEADVDYHVGVVTTDPSEGGELRSYRGDPVDGCRRCNYVARDIACPNPRFEGPPEQLIDECPALAVFADLALVGTDGSAVEAGFESAAMALGLVITDQDSRIPVYGSNGQPILEPPSANRGFFREDADLLLIFVSDEDEGFGIDGDPLRYYERIFASTRSRSDTRISVASVVGWLSDPQQMEQELPPAQEVCATLAEDTNQAAKLEDAFRRDSELRFELFGCVDAANPNEQFSSSSIGYRYIELACRLGGRVTNICDADYRDALGALAEEAVELSSSFRLSGASTLDPDCNLDCDGDEIPDGFLCVEVTPPGGEPELVLPDEEDGWSFDPEQGVLSFNGTAVPPSNSSVSIRYELRNTACGGES